MPGIVDTPLVRDVIVPNAAAALGIPEEDVIPIIAQNPEYDGLIPVYHCASALVYAIVHAREYHAQVADPFEPLDRAGIIEMPRIEVSNEIDVSGPLSGLYLKQYLGDVASVNKELEHRIDVRTRELKEERDRSESLLLSILPSPVARRLEDGEKLIADYFDDATVLFADIVGFTHCRHASNLPKLWTCSTPCSANSMQLPTDMRSKRSKRLVIARRRSGRAASGASNVVVTIVSDEVEGWHTRFSEAGAITDGEPRDNPEYQIFHFFAEDPDGHMIEVQRFWDKDWAESG